jgi:hypothetical protein
MTRNSNGTLVWNPDVEIELVYSQNDTFCGKSQDFVQFEPWTRAYYPILFFKNTTNNLGTNHQLSNESTSTLNLRPTFKTINLTQFESYFPKENEKYKLPTLFFFSVIGMNSFIEEDFVNVVVTNVSRYWIPISFIPISICLLLKLVACLLGNYSYFFYF